MEIWRAAVTVPVAHTDLFARVFDSEPAALATWGEDTDAWWLIEATYVRQRPDEAALRTRLALAAAAAGVAVPSLVLEPVYPEDWAAAALASFHPVRAGRFFIHGSHHVPAAPAACIGVRIDAATAFGTGEHGSTQGCLLALDRLAHGRVGRRRRPARVLDMGCGSGILAIAAAKQWRCPVLAVDIDVEAVRMTRYNARVNRVARLVRAAAGNGFATGAVRDNRPFDVVFENILARPVVRQAPALAGALGRNGRAVLAGFLVRHEAMVLQAHRRFGLVLERRFTRAGWSTLILRRRRRASVNRTAAASATAADDAPPLRRSRSARY